MRNWQRNFAACFVTISGICLSRVCGQFCPTCEIWHKKQKWGQKWPIVTVFTTPNFNQRFSPFFATFGTLFAIILDIFEMSFLNKNCANLHSNFQKPYSQLAQFCIVAKTVPKMGIQNEKNSHIRLQIKFSFTFFVKGCTNWVMENFETNFNELNFNQQNLHVLKIKSART